MSFQQVAVPLSVLSVSYLYTLLITLSKIMSYFGGFKQQIKQHFVANNKLLFQMLHIVTLVVLFALAVCTIGRFVNVSFLDNEHKIYASVNMVAYGRFVFGNTT